jgi:hypothetical protein
LARDPPDPGRSPDRSVLDQMVDRFDGRVEHGWTIRHASHRISRTRHGLHVQAAGRLAGP